MGLLYTIGHSKHEFEYFVNLLKRFEINYLLDVRNTPYSKYAETFNKEQLKNLLFIKGIKYFLWVNSSAQDQIILICTIRKDIWTLKRHPIQIYLSRVWKM